MYKLVFGGTKMPNSVLFGGISFFKCASLSLSINVCKACWRNNGKSIYITNNDVVVYEMHPTENVDGFNWKREGF